MYRWSPTSTPPGLCSMSPSKDTFLTGHQRCPLVPSVAQWILSGSFHRSQSKWKDFWPGDSLKTVLGGTVTSHTLKRYVHLKARNVDLFGKEVSANVKIARWDHPGLRQILNPSICPQKKEKTATSPERRQQFANSPQKPGKRLRKESLSRPTGGHNPTFTSVSDFWPPDLGDDQFPLFSATRLVVIWYSSPGN